MHFVIIKADTQDLAKRNHGVLKLVTILYNRASVLNTDPLILSFERSMKSESIINLYINKLASHCFKLYKATCHDHKKLSEYSKDLQSTLQSSPFVRELVTKMVKTHDQYTKEVKEANRWFDEYLKSTPNSTFEPFLSLVDNKKALATSPSSSDPEGHSSACRLDRLAFGVAPTDAVASSKTHCGFFATHPLATPVAATAAPEASIINLAVYQAFLDDYLKSIETDLQARSKEPATGIIREEVIMRRFDSYARLLQAQKSFSSCSAMTLFNDSLLVATNRSGNLPAREMAIQMSQKVERIKSFLDESETCIHSLDKATHIKEIASFHAEVLKRESSAHFNHKTLTQALIKLDDAVHYTADTDTTPPSDYFNLNQSKAVRLHRPATILVPGAIEGNTFTIEVFQYESGRLTLGEKLLLNPKSSPKKGGEAVKYLHAEQLIIKYIESMTKTQPSLTPTPEAPLYIGISKLSCPTCYDTIEHDRFYIRGYHHKRDNGVISLSDYNATVIHCESDALLSAARAFSDTGASTASTLPSALFADASMPSTPMGRWISAEPSPTSTASLYSPREIDSPAARHSASLFFLPEDPFSSPVNKTPALGKRTRDDAEETLYEALLRTPAKCRAEAGTMMHAASSPAHSPESRKRWPKAYILRDPLGTVSEDEKTTSVKALFAKHHDRAPSP